MKRIKNWLWNQAVWHPNDKFASRCLKVLNWISKEKYFYCWDCDGVLGCTTSECCKIVYGEELNKK